MAAATIGIAVLGAGRIGTLHAANVARQVLGARLVGVADVDLAAAQRAVEGAGAGRATVHYQELLDDPAVQAVVVATPTDTHDEVMADEARAGKHILCEKPIALTLAATRTAVKTVEQAGVLLQIGFNRRFDPAW